MSNSHEAEHWWTQQIWDDHNGWQFYLHFENYYFYFCISDRKSTYIQSFPGKLRVINVLSLNSSLTAEVFLEVTVYVSSTCKCVRGMFTFIVIKVIKPLLHITGLLKWYVIYAMWVIFYKALWYRYFQLKGESLPKKEVECVYVLLLQACWSVISVRK